MEMLQISDMVAREKNIDREIVLEAMEEAIQKASRSIYGYDNDIRAHINRKNGNVELKRYRLVVSDDAEIVNESSEICVSDAKKIDGSYEVGSEIIDDLPPIDDFGRIATQTAKQVIVQKIREAERTRQYEEYKDRVGEIVSGVVKRVEYGNVTIDLGKAEALLRRDECLPRERFENNNRVRAVIVDVREENRGPQIFLSRSHPEFMAKLFMQEVPEIYDGVIEIKAVARDPGSRAKIAVYSRDSSIDPVGACVGMRGSRVQAVVQELMGEKIDIVPWTQDIGSFVVAAMQPASVSRVVVDEESNRMEIAVPEDQLSLAIGRRGQNVRLASILTGWDIDVMTEQEESDKRNEEFNTRSALFIEALDVDDVIAQLLVTEGFARVEEVAETPVEELNQIQGFEEEISIELINRAKAWLDEKEKQFAEKRAEIGISDDLVNMEEFNAEMLIKLGENNVKTLDDLADLASDELLEIIGGSGMKESEANRIIMKAREHWFAEEDSEAENNVQEATGTDA